MSAQDRLWEHNLVQPLEMAEPVSAYAVITPDGIWHECVEAEPQDLVTQRGAAAASIASRELSRFQVAWRLEVAELLMRYQHCWLLGLDVSLTSATPRRCAGEDEPGFWPAQVEH